MNAVLHTRWGSLLDISHLMGAVWTSLFGQDQSMVRGAVFFTTRGEDIPIWSCWMMLGLLCCFCLLMLNKKIRGVEVVQ